MADDYYISGTVTLGIWSKKSAVWTQITEKVVTIYARYATAGSKTYNWDVTYDIDLGTGVQAFGVTVNATTGSGAALSDFVSAAWAAIAASGERSATPSGQLSSVIVRPI